jgi:hypothetical protein
MDQEPEGTHLVIFVVGGVVLLLLLLGVAAAFFFMGTTEMVVDMPVMEEEAQPEWVLPPHGLPVEEAIRPKVAPLNPNAPVEKLPQK